MNWLLIDIILAILLTIMAVLNFFNLKDKKKIKQFAGRLMLQQTEEINRLHEIIIAQTEENRQLKENYHALEIGRDEESDSYEQQFLTFKETIQALENARDSYILDVLEKDHLIEHHAKNCHGIVEDSVELIMERLRPSHEEKSE